MRLNRGAAVLVSVLLCPAVFLLLWQVSSAAMPDGPVWILSYPLLIALYFLLAGGIFQKKLGLRRITLWLWMLVPGYLLCWVFLLLWQPDLLQSTATLGAVLLLTFLQFPVWLVVWLGLWTANLIRSPEARGRANRFGKRMLQGLLCMAVVTPIMLIALSAKTWLAIKPPEAYEDQGVYTFTAVDYELIWEQRTRYSHSALRRHGHLSSYSAPIFRVTYETAGGLWQWQDDKGTQDIGRQAVQEGEQVERRVLSLVDGEGYITIDGAKTVQDYVDGQKLSCWVLAGGSLAVLAAEGAVWLVVRNRKIRPGRGRDADKGDTRL